MNVHADTTVLIYHRFGEDTIPSTNVPLARFTAQMEYLRENDYRVIPLSTLVEAMAAGRTLDDKTVCLTVDDGYASTYEVAWPMLRQLDFPFTVFVYVAATDRGYKNMLTWEQIREMAAAGVAIGDHGYGHRYLGRRPQGMSAVEYRQWIAGDLHKSRRLLKEHLGKTPPFLALPYGDYNSTVLAVARELGYRAVFTQDPGSVSAAVPLDMIPREAIVGDSWSTLSHLRMVLARRDLPLRDMEPAIDLHDSLQPARFAGRLLYPQRYRPESLAIYVSELGWQPAQLHGDLVYTANTQPLRRARNRVAVRGVERQSGRTAIRFWQLSQDVAP